MFHHAPIFYFVHKNSWVRLAIKQNLLIHILKRKSELGLSYSYPYGVVNNVEVVFAPLLKNNILASKLTFLGKSPLTVLMYGFLIDNDLEFEINYLNRYVKFEEVR